MRIVQTFWTAGQDPLKHAFGWLHPEYNLMSWALSCLSLREHYDEVALYTDSEGKRILIDKLHLPYTEVNVVFDDFPCLPQHWALAKIKTYSLQTKPFLHVDGDVFVPHPFSEKILHAPLVAQNREIGTAYYREMMDQVLEYKGITYPDYIDEGIHQESVASYNMGVFGGSDIDFIQRYCHEVFQFIENNSINNPKHANSKANCNVLFEQVLLALLTEKEKKNVSCVIDKKIRDNGYTVAEFCDLNKYESSSYLHILGGHKRNHDVLEMLENAMLRVDSKKYRDIIRYIKGCFNTGLSDDIGKPYMSAMMSIAQYEDHVDMIKKRWKQLSESEILQWEEQTAQFPLHISDIVNSTQNFKISCCKNIDVFKIPNDWHPWATEQLKSYLRCEKNFPLRYICSFPTITRKGIKEFALSEIGKRILEFVKDGTIYIEEVMQKTILSLNVSKTSPSYHGARRHVMTELSYLIRNGIIVSQN